MFGMKGIYISASGAIQGHHGPLVFFFFFQILLENFLSFSSDLKLIPANSFSLEELKFVVWDWVNLDNTKILWFGAGYPIACTHF